MAGMIDLDAPIRLVRKALGLTLDVLLPPLCLSCQREVGAVGRLCPDCWSGVRFIGPPLCAACGVPFELAAGEAALCGACIQAPPRYQRGRSVFVYEGVGRNLVLGFKMADRGHAAPTLAAWLARAGAPLLAGADVIVPVPLHRLRLAARRFNQSALLAASLARQSGVSWLPDGLVRTRATPSQALLSARARATNVRGAFRVRERCRPRIAGRRVLLIDDVMTTGATAEACAQALFQAGASAVDVLTLARTLHTSP
jgi:ComF family protein